MRKQQKTTEAESTTQLFIYRCNGNGEVNKVKLARNTYLFVLRAVQKYVLPFQTRLSTLSISHFWNSVMCKTNKQKNENNCGSRYVETRDS